MLADLIYTIHCAISMCSTAHTTPSAWARHRGLARPGAGPAQLHAPPQAGPLDQSSPVFRALLPLLAGILHRAHDPF